MEEGRSHDQDETALTSSIELAKRFDAHLDVLHVPSTRVVLEQCRLWDDQFLVMGAYSRIRLRETILGGVTKEVLTDSDLPTLICR